MHDRIKILIIEDEDSILTSILAHFEDYDYETCYAKNGEEGIEKFLSEEPDLVFTDLRMPVLDGIGVLKWFKENRPDVPRIVVSGAGDINLVVEALHLGAWDYILKPIENLSVLTYTAKSVFERSRLQKENIKYRDQLEELVKQRTEALKLTNLALSESEKKYRILAENVADVIWVLDLNLNLVYISPSIFKSSGYTVDEYLNLVPFSDYKPESKLRMIDTLKREVQNVLIGQSNHDKIITIEVELIRKDNSTFWADTNIKFIYDDFNNATGILGVSRDITERKQAAEEMRAAKEKAEEMNRLKSIFLSNISHELRTPLVGLLGFSEILLSEADGKNKMYAEMIARSGQRLKTTLNTALDYTEIESGKIKIVNTLVDIPKLIREEIKLFEPAVKRKGLYLRENIHFENCLILTDEKKVREIITNLISNAVKFTSEGGVEVFLKKDDYSFQIKVEDSGVGIPSDKFDIIFEEFRQVSEGQGRSFEGAGLGLTITKKYVERLEGKISVESKLGIGSIFTVTIPFTEEKIEDRANQNMNLEQSDYSSDSKNYQILVVEDDKLSLIAITNMLNKSFHVTEALSASEAIQAVKLKKFDAICMDINLGTGMSGVEAIKEIRKIDTYKSTPIIALTAYATIKNREEFLGSGFTHHMAKPFRRKDIVALLDKIFTNQQSVI